MAKGIERIKGVWEITAVLELTAAFEIPATALAQMIKGGKCISEDMLVEGQIQHSGKSEGYERTAYGVLLMVVASSGFIMPVPIKKHIFRPSLTTKGGGFDC